MARKVDVSLIAALNAAAEGQKKPIIEQSKKRHMNFDECIEYLRAWGQDKKGD
jgi:hypothetical protein